VRWPLVDRGGRWFTPLNEPSWFAWAAGEVGLLAPHARERGYELKLQLARAALRGIEALRAAAPDTRILSVDSLRRPAGPQGSEDRETVFESLDLLAGRLRPELGGSREALGVIGIHDGWKQPREVGADAASLADDEPRPLRELVREVWERYGGELVICETGRASRDPVPRLRRVADEAEALLEEGVPLRGVRLYPILGMPESDERRHAAPSALWHVVPSQPLLGRQLHRPLFFALCQAQRLERRARSSAQSFASV
jgi:hypothetical protein